MLREGDLDRTKSAAVPPFFLFFFLLLILLLLFSGQVSKYL
jgi:hypothetical protein